MFIIYDFQLYHLYIASPTPTFKRILDPHCTAISIKLIIDFSKIVNHIMYYELVIMVILQLCIVVALFSTVTTVIITTFVHLYNHVVFYYHMTRLVYSTLSLDNSCNNIIFYVLPFSDVFSNNIILTGSSRI